MLLTNHGVCLTTVLGAPHFQLFVSSAFSPPNRLCLHALSTVPAAVRLAPMADKAPADSLSQVQDAVDQVSQACGPCPRIDC